MGKTNRNSRLTALLLLGLLTACSRPDGDYCFVSAETAKHNGGSYTFEPVFDDTTCVYASCLAARIVTGRISAENFDVDIWVVSPDGEIRIDRCSLPIKESPDVRVRLGAGSVADFEWPWRDFSVNGEQSGRWQIVITPAQADAVYGIGLSYKTKLWEKEN